MTKNNTQKNKKNFKLVLTKIFVFVISSILFLGLFLSRSPLDLTIKMLVFALVSYSSFSLIKNVKYEIDSRKRMEQLAREFASMNEDLHELNKQKSDFVVASAYHLRAPLTAVSGYASMALEGSFGKMADDVMEAIDRIFKSSKRLSVIVDDFTNISRIESGEIEYVFASADLSKIIKDLIVEMNPLAESHNLALTYKIDENEHYEMNIDKGKIRQAISNLVDNAIKYTPNGSVGVSLGKTKEGKIKIKIYDTGIGMDKETIEKIFFKFTRADVARKFYTEGSGLGLYVAYEILKKHGARIWAESAGVGQGSVFHIEFNADKLKLDDKKIPEE